MTFDVQLRPALGTTPGKLPLHVCGRIILGSTVVLWLAIGAAVRAVAG